MKKIAIISMYYNNSNYGGLLQSYALTKLISRFNCVAEQLCIDVNTYSKLRIKRKIKLKKFFRYIRVGLRCVFDKFGVFLIKNKINLRHLKMKNFQERISHSKNLYTSETINESLIYYDTFITGSDQVWNMSWYRKEYFLDFVPDDRYKFSYAASMPDVGLTQEQKKTVINHLKSFDDISVRESCTAEYLTELLGRKVEWVLDPTLLLESDDWDEICSGRIINDQYIFCYFLGCNIDTVKIVRKFARKMNMKIVSLPNLLGKLNKPDMMLGGNQLYDVSPGEFISLIKNAEYVITDSFHACIFSNVYKVKYFVFKRLDINNMFSRISSLLSMFESEYRFCGEKESPLEYMLSIKDEKVCDATEGFLEMKKKSIEFLHRNINSMSRE